MPSIWLRIRFNSSLSLPARAERATVTPVLCLALPYSSFRLVDCTVRRAQIPRLFSQTFYWAVSPLSIIKTGSRIRASMVTKNQALTSFGLFFFGQTVLFQQSHDFIARPQVVVDLAVFCLADCCEFDWLHTKKHISHSVPTRMICIV